MLSSDKLNRGAALSEWGVSLNILHGSMTSVSVNDPAEAESEYDIILLS